MVSMIQANSDIVVYKKTDIA